MATAVPAWAVSSHKTQFTFGGVEYHCTDISFDESAEEPNKDDTRKDISTLDLAHGAERVYIALPLTEPADNTLTTTKTISISFIGATQPSAGTTAAVVTAGVTGNYKCTKSTITRKVGEYVEGSASFTFVPTVAP